MNRAENADTRTDARKKAIEVEEKVVEMCSELYEAAGKKPPKTLKPPSVPKKARRRMGGGGPKPLLVSTLEGFKRVIGAGLGEGRGGSLGEGASQEEARGGQGRRGEGAGRSSGPRESTGRGCIAALVSGVEAARTLQEARRMMSRGADSDASALVSADEFRADFASRPAERGDESGRAVKRMPSQCVFRHARASPRARPRTAPSSGARVLSFFFYLRNFFLEKFPWNQNSIAAHAYELELLAGQRPPPWGLEGSGSPGP